MYDPNERLTKLYFENEQKSNSFYDNEQNQPSYTVNDEMPFAPRRPDDAVTVTEDVLQRVPTHFKVIMIIRLNNNAYVTV